MSFIELNLLTQRKFFNKETKQSIKQKHPSRILYKFYIITNMQYCVQTVKENLRQFNGILYHLEVLISMSILKFQLQLQ